MSGFKHGYNYARASAFNSSNVLQGGSVGFLWGQNHALAKQARSALCSVRLQSPRCLPLVDRPLREDRCTLFICRGFEVG